MIFFEGCIYSKQHRTTFPKGQSAKTKHAEEVFYASI